MNDNAAPVEKPKVCSLEYFCEVCDYYPLYPVHGHYECPQCRYKTKCCEGAPQNE
jgi:hypothetical protein